MNFRKLYTLMFVAYLFLPAITGLGISYTESNHALLSTWYVLGFEIGIGLTVICGFYSLYQYQLKIDQEKLNKTHKEEYHTAA